MPASNIPNPVDVRTTLLRMRGWTLERVFDTNEHEPHKDVSLVRTETGELRVLRVGERRPPTFFPGGYHGMHIVVPKLFETTSGPGRAPFEVEEYLPGDLLSDIDPQPSATDIVRGDFLEKLIAGFWEMQTAFRSEPLTEQWRMEEKLEKHLRAVRALLTEDAYRTVARVIARNEAFFDPLHTQPAKWKYALDNVILMPDGRLGLVDFARVGLYPWGYDLGWIVWPRWFRLPQEAWQDSTEHLAALDRFVHSVVRLAPPRERMSATLEQRINLVLVERTIGALYDIATPTPHARRIAEDPVQRERFLSFLHAVLAWSLDGC